VFTNEWDNEKAARVFYETLAALFDQPEAV